MSSLQYWKSQEIEQRLKVLIMSRTTEDRKCKSKFEKN